MQRVPFLKKEVIEYSFSLNPKIRIYKNQLKGILKETFSQLLPNEIIYRGKRGFSIPLHNWRNILEKRSSKQEKILDDFDFYVE